MFRIPCLFHKHSFGGDSGGVPHVPIPNTTVKPSSADGTWTEGSWESRTPPSNPYSLIAQLVEHSTVNRVVTGSSPVRGAIMERCPSWPKEHDWKSCRRQKRLEGSNPSLSASLVLLRPVGQGVKTPPFHGGNRGSNPLRVIVIPLQ